jgi:vacuolar-type H+-ATPase subunit C/Vma6
MCAARYSYINAKLRAHLAEILAKEQWDALLGARDMLAAIRVLDATAYSDLVKDFTANTSPQEVEHVLQDDFNHALTEIIEDAPGATQRLMVWIARKFQKEIVKTLLRLKTTKADEATANRLLLPLNPFTMPVLRGLLEAADLRLFAARLPDPLFRQLVEESLPRYEESHELLHLEQPLDRVVFQNLQKEAQRLKGLDRQVTLQLVGLETDLINLSITLRSRFLRMPLPEAKQLLLEAEYELPRILCEDAIQAQTLEESVRLLKNSRYGTLVTQAWEAYEHYHTLRAFEQGFHQRIRTASRDAMLGFPFHFGVLLGYLNLKWYETLNLKALINGKSEGLDAPTIRRALIL